MIGYQDRTWCKSPRCQNKCGRRFTDEDRQLAIEWWGSDDFPIAFGFFCDDDGEVIRT